MIWQRFRSLALPIRSNHHTHYNPQLNQLNRHLHIHLYTFSTSHNCTKHKYTIKYVPEYVFDWLHFDNDEREKEHLMETENDKKPLVCCYLIINEIHSMLVTGSFSRDSWVKKLWKEERSHVIVDEVPFFQFVIQILFLLPISALKSGFLKLSLSLLLYSFILYA